MRFADSDMPEQRAEWQAALALELYLTGQLDEAVAARRAALDHHERAGDVAAAGEDLRWLARLCWYAGRTVDAEAFAARAVAVSEGLGLGRTLAMAWTTRSQLAMVRGEYRAAIELGRRALEIAAEVGDVETRIHALNTIGASLTDLGDPAGVPMMEESLELAQAAQQDDHTARAYVNLVFAATCMRDYPLLDRYLDQALAHCASHEVEVQRMYLEASRLLSEVHRARWDGIEREAEVLLNQAATSPVHRFVSSLPLALVRIRTGYQAGEQIGELRSLAAELDEPQRRDPALLAEAERAWLAGDLEEHLEELDHAAVAAMERGDSISGEVVWWIRRADQSYPAPEASGPFAKALTGPFEEAVALWQSIGYPYEATITLLDGDEDDVRAALATFTRLGAVPAALVARKRLAALGVRGPRTTTASNEFGLTNRQREILELLRQQRTNAQIAAELVLSERTVHHHVSAILAKLGVSSRAEAARYGHGQEQT